MDTIFYKQIRLEHALLNMISSKKINYRHRSIRVHAVNHESSVPDHDIRVSERLPDSISYGRISPIETAYRTTCVDIYMKDRI